MSIKSTIVSARYGRQSLTALVPGLPLAAAPPAAGAPGSALAHQLWRAETGVLPSS